MRAGGWYWQVRFHLARQDHAAAIRSAQRALTAFGSTPDPRFTLPRVQAQHLLSGIYLDLGDHEAAERLLQEALAALPIVAGDRPGNVAVIETLTSLGNLARLRGRYQQAEQYLQRALTIAADHSGQALPKAGAQNTLAITYKDTGRSDEAAELYQEVLSAVLATGGPTSSAAATSYHNLAGLAHARGDYRSAEQFARYAVQLRTRPIGAHRLELAADLTVLAAALLGEHRLREAEQAYRQALHIYTRAFGVEHYEVAVVLNGLATIETERGRPDQAEPLYRHALQIKERVLGPEHPEIGVLLNNMAVMHRKAGRPDDASDCYRKALPLLTRSLGGQHPTVMTCRDNLAAPTARAASDEPAG